MAERKYVYPIPENTLNRLILLGWRFSPGEFPKCTAHDIPVYVVEDIPDQCKKEDKEALGKTVGSIYHVYDPPKFEPTQSSATTKVWTEAEACDATT